MTAFVKPTNPPAAKLMARRNANDSRISWPPIGTLLAIFGTLMLGACADNNPVIPSPAVAPNASLKQFDGPRACEQLEVAIESSAKAMMREQVSGLRSYARVSDPVTGQPTPTPVAAPAPENDANQGESISGDPGGSNYSETNVQVAGIDELDVVKNNGLHLYTLASVGDEVILTKASLRPAVDMQISGQARWAAKHTTTNGAGLIPAPEYPVGMFLNGTEQIVTVGSGAAFYAYPPIDSPLVDADVSIARLSICSDEGCGPGGGQWAPPQTTMRGFDVSQDSPVQEWTIELPGQLLEARRIGNKAYVITKAPLHMPSTVRWWPDIPSGDNSSTEWNASIERLLTANELAIDSTPLSNWLAPLRLSGDSASEPTAAECAAFSAPQASVRLNWLRVNTIDLETQSVDHRTILASGQSVFMSASSLLVSTNYWAPTGTDRPFNSGAGTLLHRFSIGEDRVATYDASGALSGRLINRFAIGESSDSVIYAAMSDRSDTGPYSYLATLASRDGKLQTLGRSDVIAPGETLQSARFVGDRAYLVTFLVVDPFFVFDLSDPARPAPLGELKIPGFSSYLHPLGENHVLGIGYDDGGWPRRIKASLFDVTNPANPLEQSVLSLGDSYVGSDALWDPHAFTYYRPDPTQAAGYMAVPIRSYQSTRYGTQSETGIRIVAVNPSELNNGLQLQGTLDMSDLLTDNNSVGPWRNTDARRAVFIDADVYGVSDAAIRSAPIAQPETVLDTVLIPR
ncbi:MAG: beta-propeller domain-containing protein [Burkholderiaceae bacterium]